jgi:hypothetical protein
MADAQTMIVQTESGESYENPSGGLLWTLLDKLGPAESSYLLAYPADDPETYLIAAHTRSGDFFLQMQTPDGAGYLLPGGGLTLEQAHEILVRWALGKTPWTDLGDWAPVPKD